MKRIKVMLLSFALLAVVGGALAFKAKFGTIPFCYTTTTVVTTTCQTTLYTGEVDALQQTIYTTIPQIFNINGEEVLKCYTTDRILDPTGTLGITTWLTCTTAGKYTIDN